jgi:multidrug efflux pump subunit AcrA (membrane-fusion protein)
MRFFETQSNWWDASPRQRRIALVGIAAVVLLVGIRALSVRKVEGESGAPAGRGNGAGKHPSVDVVLARAGVLREELEYTGTTRPTQEISLRSRTEGRLLSLNADVGDMVRRGQEIGRVDDTLLRTALRQVEAELASRQSEAASTRNDVAGARTQVEQARADLAQKEADFKRVHRLWGEGYEAKQTAERALTAARMARQVLRSTQEQVRSAQSSVRAAEGRVAAQKAVVAQERERLSYSSLRSPIDGSVTARFVQAGDLVQNGADVVRIGDFRMTQVDVQVSELELGHVAVGQPARVRLDALSGRELQGRVDRISPQADPVSRLVPVTVTLSNEAGRLGAGMLARVRFGAVGVNAVLIPEAAPRVALPMARRPPRPALAKRARARPPLCWWGKVVPRMTLGKPRRQRPMTSPPGSIAWKRVGSGSAPAATDSWKCWTAWFRESGWSPAARRR